MKYFKTSGNDWAYVYKTDGGKVWCYDGIWEFTGTSFGWYDCNFVIRFLTKEEAFLELL